MPEMDGYELTRRIREIEKGETRTVVLAFTANTLREAADECRTAGMDDVLTKPIELRELKAKLDHWLPLKGAEPEAAHLPHVAARVAPDGSITGEFCLAHDEDMDLLRKAVRDRRPDSVVRAGHRIKGAARMYGDELLAAAAAELERIARESESWDTIEAAARTVDRETQRLFAHSGWLSQSRRA
jgi:response regulator RpfG family c-di-GMP phosphodiesterase